MCFLRLSPYKCAINLFYILHCIEQIEFTFYLYALGLPDKIQDAQLNLNFGYTAESYLNFTFNWSPAFYLLNLATFRWTYPPSSSYQSLSGCSPKLGDWAGSDAGSCLLLGTDRSGFSSLRSGSFPGKIFRIYYQCNHHENIWWEHCLTLYNKFK